MEITYLGYSCFRIKTHNIVLITDPFDEKAVGFKLPSQEAEIVTISHHHPGHDNLSVVKNIRKVIDGPGEYEIGGVTIMGFTTFHDDNQGVKRGKNTVYLIESNEIKVLHLGDLGHMLSDKLLEEIGEVNVLMIGSGHPMSLDTTKAVEVVRAIEPQITIPMHFSYPGNVKDVKLEPVDHFLKEIGLSVERLPKLSIKYSELGEEQKIVLLEKRQ